MLFRLIAVFFFLFFFSLLFPLGQGTCLGFEMVGVFVGGTAALEGGFDSEDLPAPLNFTSNLSKSKIFANARPELIKALSTGVWCVWRVAYVCACECMCV